VFTIPLGFVAAGLYRQYASYQPDWLTGLILIAPMAVVADYTFWARTSGNSEHELSSAPKERPLGL
jgi:hypothetical protein